MMTRSNYEREIHEIRYKLYEESKTMTSEERDRKGNQLAHELAKKYGFRIIPTKPVRNPV